MDRDQVPLPPVVPPEFWEAEHMQGALRSRHMGKVIRAYRQHRDHGYRGLSQDHVARWAGISQGQLSRLENGPAPLRIDQLAYWARLLGIPKRYHWFELPLGDDPDASGKSTTDADAASGISGHPGAGDQVGSALADRLRASAMQDRPSDALLTDLITDLKEELRQELKSSVAQIQQGAGGDADVDRPRSARDMADQASHRSTSTPAPGTARRVRDKRRGGAGATGGPPVLAGRRNSALDDAGTGEDPTKDPTPTLPNPPIDIDIHTAQPARMGNYLAGGGANFDVDREATEYIAGAVPGGIDTIRAMLADVVTFQGAVVRYLAGERGVQQFLNVATSIPREPKIHEVAQEIAPQTRFIYVIEDGVVMAHAHRFLSSTPEGATGYIRGGLRDPAKILRQAGATLDLAEPVGILIRGGDLNLIPDDDAAYLAVAQLIDAVPSDSYLVLTHLASDMRADGLSEAFQRIDTLVEEAKMPPLAARSRGHVLRFFDGLELLGPGVVPVNRWCPPETTPAPANGPDVPFYGAVGRKR